MSLKILRRRCESSSISAFTGTLGVTDAEVIRLVRLEVSRPIDALIVSVLPHFLALRRVCQFFRLGGILWSNVTVCRLSAFMRRV